MQASIRNLPLAMDGRLLAGIGGVATYARALRRAQVGLWPGSMVVCDAADAARRNRLARRASAILPFAHAARAETGTDGSALLRGRDLFRLAQIFFDVHRRPMPIRAAGPPGIVHWSYPLPLRIAGWRNVYTVHDAIPLLRPDLTDIDELRHRRLLRSITADAAALVTVSRTARAQVAQALGIDPTTIIDCGQAIDPPLPGPPPAGLAPGAYLLVLGSVEPRKNIAALLEAYRRSGVDRPLVIAGAGGPGAAALDAAIAAIPGALRLQPPDGAGATALLAHARLLLMPSLAEGFGLPVAEAMALGTPVITSRGGALEETAGGAAYLVDPADPGDIAAAIGLLDGDDDRRARLAAAGRRNAARFAPARFAAALASVYGALAGTEAT